MTRLQHADTETGETMSILPGMKLNGIQWDRSHPLARLETLEHRHQGFRPISISVDSYSEHRVPFPGKRLQAISDGKRFRVVTRQSRTQFEKDAYRRHPVVMMEEMDGVVRVPLVNALGFFRMLVDADTFEKIDKASGWLGGELLDRGVTVHDKLFEDEDWAFDAWIKDAGSTVRKATFIW